MPDSSIPPLPDAVSALLIPGEKVLWHAQPRPYVFLLRGLPNIAYGVTWAVLGAFWYRGAGGVGHQSAFDGWWRLTPLFSLPFIFAGFSFFLAPIRLGARARRTWYVVTDQRVFTAELRPAAAPLLHVFSSEDLHALQFIKRGDGLHELHLSSRAAANPHLKPRLEEGFFGIAHGDEAMEAIRISGATGGALTKDSPPA
jgi:hypothetical protein